MIGGPIPGSLFRVAGTARPLFCARRSLYGPLLGDLAQRVLKLLVRGLRAEFARGLPEGARLIFLFLGGGFTHFVHRYNNSW